MMMEKEHIYIIDDNALICESIKFLLESFNYKVTYYQNPLHFFQQDAAQLRGCVIVDLLMPNMNGLECIKRIRMINHFIKIIVVSGNGTSETEQRMREEGAQSFLTKPFNIEHLLKEINHLLKEPMFR